jgi:TRAP-type C4-dicarboxylate transport system substrate-binding protein
MRKLYVVLLALSVLAGPLAGCATGVNYWNQLSPTTQAALIQAAAQTAQAGLMAAQSAYTAYLEDCRLKGVQADAQELAKLTLARDLAQAEFDRLVKPKGK